MHNNMLAAATSAPIIDKRPVTSHALGSGSKESKPYYLWYLATNHCSQLQPDRHAKTAAWWPRHRTFKLWQAMVLPASESSCPCYPKQNPGSVGSVCFAAQTDEVMPKLPIAVPGSNSNCPHQQSHTPKCLVGEPFPTASCAARCQNNHAVMLFAYPHMSAKAHP